MGKKSGRSGGAKAKDDGATAFMLKVAMHCHCQGCTDKIRAAVKDLTLHHGIEELDQTALSTKGELKLLATADPEQLRRRLHKATRKQVDLVPLAAPKKQDKDAASSAATAAALQALLLRNPHYGLQQAAWPDHHHQVLPAAAWNAAAQHHHHQQQGTYAYPWALQQQQPEAYAYPGSAVYPSAPASAWGGYAYPAAAHGYGGGLFHGY